MCCESCQLLGLAAVSQEQCVTLLLQLLRWKQSFKQGQECYGLDTQIYLRYLPIHPDSRFFALWKTFGITGLEVTRGSIVWQFVRSFCPWSPTEGRYIHRFLPLASPPFLMMSDITHKYTKIWQVSTLGNDLSSHNCLSLSLPSLSTVHPFPWALTRASVVTLADVNILPENVLPLSGNGHRGAMAFQECHLHRCWQARLAWGRLNSHCCSW